MVSHHKRHQRIYVTNQLMENFMYFLEYWYWLKVFFSVILSIQCKIRRDRPAELRRSTGRSRSTCWPSWCRLTCLQEFIDTAVRWVCGWSRLVTGHKEAEAAEVKPSQNLPWHSKTALNACKFRQQLAKLTSNNDKK